MSNQVILIGIGVITFLFILVVIAYLILKKKREKSTIKQVVSLTKGTKETFSFDKLFQRVYIICTSIPVIKRYTLKLRRRVEIINLR